MAVSDGVYVESVDVAELLGAEQIVDAAVIESRAVDAYYS